MKNFGWIFRSGVLFSSFKELVKLVFTRPDSIPLFAMTGWSMWFHKNKIWVGENARPLGQLVSFARDYVRDFKSLRNNSSTVRVSAPKIWSPPNRYTWKINFDGALYGESAEAGVGEVV